MNARKLSLSAVAAAVLGTLAFGASASSASTPSQPAKTSVTIHSWSGGLYGYVTSRKANGCANNRPVAVFEQPRGGRNPTKDKRIATAVARRNHGAYQWSSNSRRSGSFYARAQKKDGCGVASSKAVSSRPTDAPAPSCPSTTEVCTFNLHVDMPFCPAFSSPVGLCPGKSFGTPGWAEPVFQIPALYAGFNWGPLGQGAYRLQYNGFNIGPVSYLAGSIPGSHLAEFTVSDAWALKWPHPSIRFVTPDLPGKRAGEQGGPLYLNFKNGHPGADAYIHGFLFRR